MEDCVCVACVCVCVCVCVCMCVCVACSFWISTDASDLELLATSSVCVLMVFTIDHSKFIEL